MKKIVCFVLFVFFCSLMPAAAADAAAYDQVLQRWTKNRKIIDEDGANLEIKATYYSAEYIEALMQKEAQANLWTDSE
ncbi:MAG: hypothetical protein EOM37_18550, partial [Proteobacteria bacterium]|nr:hypothetical protein [Pseudomonadota bacterium]